LILFLRIAIVARIRLIFFPRIAVVARIAIVRIRVFVGSFAIVRMKAFELQHEDP
jgi:hypothetical protein